MPEDSKVQPLKFEYGWSPDHPTKTTGCGDPCLKKSKGSCVNKCRPYENEFRSKSKKTGRDTCKCVDPKKEYIGPDGNKKSIKGSQPYRCSQKPGYKWVSTGTTRLGTPAGYCTQSSSAWKSKSNQSRSQIRTCEDRCGPKPFYILKEIDMDGVPKQKCVCGKYRHDTKKA